MRYAIDQSDLDRMTFVELQHVVNAGAASHAPETVRAAKSEMRERLANSGENYGE